MSPITTTLTLTSEESHPKLRMRLFGWCYIILAFKPLELMTIRSFRGELSRGLGRLSKEDDKIRRRKLLRRLRKLRRLKQWFKLDERSEGAGNVTRQRYQPPLPRVTMLQVKKGKEECLIESLLTSPLANSLVAPANSLSGGLIRALKQSSFPIINIGRNFKRLIRGFMEIPCVIKLSLQKEWNSLEIVDELSNLVICG